MKNNFFSAINVFRFISRSLSFCFRQLNKCSDSLSQYLNYNKYDPKLNKNKYISLSRNPAMTELIRGKKKFKKLMDKKLRENGIEIKSSFLIKTLQQRKWEFYTSFYNADLKNTDVVLDTGAYNTYFCVLLKDYVKKIYTTDSFYWAERHHIKEFDLPLPEQWMSEINKVEQNKLIAQKADLIDLPFKNNEFDKIFCISVIEHVKDDLKGMEEMFRVLKRGGILLLTTEVNKRLSKPYSETDKSYYRVYSYEQIMSLIKKSGFKFAGKNKIIETIGEDGKSCEALFVLRK